MLRSSAKVATSLVAIAIALTAIRTEAAVFATYDAAQHNANGFFFGDFADFSDPVTTTGGVISIDIMTDFDGSNGLFGGMGSDLVADFEAATTNLDVTLTVGPNNAASAFRVTLRDDDGAGSADEHVYEFDISGLTPGVQTTLSQPLNLGPLFSQGAFGMTPGDGLQNFGLTQLQIQSVFESTDRLNILVDSVSLEDPEDPLLIEYTAGTFQAQTQSFAFGTFQDQSGAFDVTGPNIIINADAGSPPGTEGVSGGAGFNGLNIDFEATEYQIEFEAKILPGNTATQVNVLLGDIDGDDSGPMLGSDDYIFAIDLANFNETDFSTFTLPLGSGSEDDIATTFGFTNGGDGLQNFDLTQMQIQADADSGGLLNLEIARFSIVERTAVEGDIDGDGDIDGQDFLAIQRGFGTTTDATTLAAWQAAYDGGGNLAAASVPEPTSCLLLLSAVGLISLRCQVRD